MEYAGRFRYHVFPDMTILILDARKLTSAHISTGLGLQGHQRLVREAHCRARPPGLASEMRLLWPSNSCLTALVSSSQT